MIELDAGPIDQPALGFSAAERTCMGRAHPVEAR